MIGVRGIIVLWAALQIVLAVGLAIWDWALWPALLLALGAVPALLVAAGRPAAVAAVSEGAGSGAVSAHRVETESEATATKQQPGQPAASLGVPVLAAGLTMAGVGLTAGLWFVLLGAEVAVAGCVLLAMEIAHKRRGTRS